MAGKKIKVKRIKFGVEIPEDLDSPQLKPTMRDIKNKKIVKKRFGGKVIQKMQSGGRKLSQEELEAAIREIEEQGTVFGKGSGLSKDQTKKIADSFEKSFNDIFGKKFGGVIKKMKKGGLMEAIKKVQAKEMKLGGDVPKPLVGGQKKLDKNKDGKISGADFKLMKMGGKVEEYGAGGNVGKGGKMACRGMGAAIKGGGFTIR